MAFCSSCGGQLAAGERFCGKCGADQLAKAAGAPVAAAPPVAQYPAAPPVAQYPSPAAAPQMPYVAPGQVPMSVAMPPPAPAKKSGMMWLGIIAAAAIGYYYYSHHIQPQTPGTTPAGQPGPQQPGPQQPGPGGNPAGQPGKGDSLTQMQSWAGTISEDNGNVEISNGKWTNSATVAVATVTLTCIQYNDGGQALNTDTATLSGPNGPAPAQSTVTFDPFSVGPVVQGATKANCGITAATAAQ